MKMTAKERKLLLSLYEDLRVADVRDGLDTIGLHHQCSMSPLIRPLYRTRSFGIARTARYLPWRGMMPKMNPQAYWKWVARYYETVCTYDWMSGIEPGDFCVIDQSGLDAGLMGSNNSLGGFKAGARAYVTNGGVRDTDELISQRIPFWSAAISQKMVQCRLQYDAMQVPVAVGGVTVCPGDVVVADGDGVIVVPRGLAREVARHAHAEHRRDKAGRKRLYQEMGMPLDESVLDNGRR